jgi:site-specific recombinase XerD
MASLLHGACLRRLLGDRDVTTTEIYTHVRNMGPSAVRSLRDGVLGGDA